MLLCATHILKTLKWAEEAMISLQFCGIKEKDLPIGRCEACQTRWRILPKDLQRYRYGFFITCPICGKKTTFSAYYVPESFLPYIYNVGEGKVPNDAPKGIMTSHD